MENFIDGFTLLFDIAWKLLLLDYAWRVFKVYVIERDEELGREEA